MFQSTRPRGARRGARQQHIGGLGVSIHAPAWGATRDGVTPACRPSCFNPRARVGRDRELRYTPLPELLFQSTRPRGARLHERVRQTKIGRFQSTRPRGARRCVARNCVGHRGFQSTRPRGARQTGAADRADQKRVSIHAPAWGATGTAPPRSSAILPFQSTRPRGARRSHHNSLRDKDFFYEIREPMSPIDPKGTGQVATTQKANEINTLLKCEPSRESRTA